jgi:hypothetical protein
MNNKNKLHIAIIIFIIIIIFIYGFVSLLLPHIYPNQTSENEEKYNAVLSLLDSESCWMGICPGITSADDAKEIITKDNKIVFTDIEYWGNEQNGGMRWKILPDRYYSSINISWENKVIEEISIYSFYSGKYLYYFLDIYGEPDYVLPIKNVQVDTPSYWTVRLYYLQRGIEIVAQNKNGSDLFTEKDLPVSIIIYIPISMNDRINDEFTQNNIDKYISKVVKWHGFGDVVTY